MKASGNGAPEICVQNSDSDLKAMTAQAGDFELRASIDNIT